MTIRHVVSSNQEQVYVGFIWDEYTPQVETNLAKDLMSFKGMYGSLFTPVCLTDEAERVVLALGLRSDSDANLATVWKAYIVNNEPELPDNAEEVFCVRLKLEPKPFVMQPKPQYAPELTVPGDQRTVPEFLRLNLYKRPPKTHGLMDRNSFWYMGF